MNDDGTDATWMVPFLDIVSSFRLAMEAEGIDLDTIESVVVTVVDYAANNHGDD